MSSALLEHYFYRDANDVWTVKLGKEETRHVVSPEFFDRFIRPRVDRIGTGITNKSIYRVKTTIDSIHFGPIRGWLVLHVDQGVIANVDLRNEDGNAVISRSIRSFKLWLDRDAISTVA